MPMPFLIRFIVPMVKINMPTPHPSVVSIGNRIKDKGSKAKSSPAAGMWVGMEIVRTLRIMAMRFGLQEVKAIMGQKQRRIIANITMIEHCVFTEELMPIAFLIGFISLLEQIKKPSPHPSVASIGNRIRIKKARVGHYHWQEKIIILVIKQIKTIAFIIC